jgi:WD40 repeat protein
MLAFGGGGSFLAVARMYNHSLFLVDPQSGRILHSLDVGDEVSAVDCSEKLIIAAGGRTLRIWAAKSPYKLLSQVELPIEIRSLDIAADERRAAIVTEAGIFILDLGFELVYQHTPRELKPTCVSGSTKDSRAIAISADGSLVALAESSVASVWRLTNNAKPDTELLAAPLRKFDMEKHVHFLEWSQDGHLMIGDWAHGLRLWDVSTGAEAGAVVPQDSTGTIVAISADGGKVATIKDDKILTAWHTKENEPRLRVRIGNAFSHARFAGEGQFLITRSGEVQNVPLILRDARTGIELSRISSEGAMHNEITVSPDGQAVAIHERSGVVLRSIPDLKEIRTLRMDDLNHVVFDRSGKHGIITANFDGDIQAWPSDRPITLAKVGDFYAGSLDVTPDGRYALIAARKRVLLVDLLDGKEVFRQAVDEWGDLHAAIARDGSCIVVGQNDRLWTLNMDGSRNIEFAWGKYNTTSNHAAVVGLLAFSPDSKRLATATGEGWIYLWDVASGELIQLMRVDDEPLKDLAFSTSGQEIVTCTAVFEGEYDSIGYAEIWPAPDLDGLIILAKKRTFRSITPEELIQYGLTDREAAGSAASMFHLTRP